MVRSFLSIAILFPLLLSLVVSPSAYASSPTPSTQTEKGPCPEGKLRTEDTAGNCCWPGQAWSNTRSQCLGEPIACPPQMSIDPTGCVASETPELPDTSTDVSASDQESVTLEWLDEYRDDDGSTGVQEPPAQRVDESLMREQYSQRKVRFVGNTPHQNTRRLEGADFYHAIGRTDLANRYKTWRPSYVVFGGLGIAGGVLSWKRDDGGGGSFVLGLLAMTGGLIAFFEGLSPFDPMSTAEKRAAVRDYNNQLAQELGLENVPRSFHRTDDLGPNRWASNSSEQSTILTFSIRF